VDLTSVVTVEALAFGGRLALVPVAGSSRARLASSGRASIVSRSALA